MCYAAIRANSNRFRSHSLRLFDGATYRPTELTRRLNSSILHSQYHNNIQKEYKLIKLHFYVSQISFETRLITNHKTELQLSSLKLQRMVILMLLYTSTII